MMTVMRGSTPMVGCFGAILVICAVLLLAADAAPAGGIFTGFRGLLGRNKSEKSIHGRGGSVRIRSSDADVDDDEPMAYGPLLDSFRDEVREVVSECRLELRRTFACLEEEICRAKSMREENSALADDDEALDEMVDSLSRSKEKVATGWWQRQKSFDVFTDLPDEADENHVLEESVETTSNQTSPNFFAEVVAEPSDFVVGDTDEAEEIVVSRLFAKSIFGRKRKKMKKDRKKDSSVKFSGAANDVELEPAATAYDDVGSVGVNENAVTAKPADVGTLKKKRKKKSSTVAAMKPTAKPKIPISNLNVDWKYRAGTEIEDVDSTALFDTSSDRSISPVVQVISQYTTVALLLLLSYWVANLVASAVLRVLKPKGM